MDRNKIIISTCLKDTWVDSKEAFFTGEWCINYKEKIPYKKFFIEKDLFKDRKGLYNDYVYLTKLYNKILSSFCVTLNKHHGIERSEKFWGIFFGLWLRTFLEVAYVHYHKISKIFSMHNPSFSIRRKFNNNHFFLKNYKIYIQCMQSNSWRHYLQSEIISNIKKKNFILENIYPEDDNEFLEYKKIKIKKNIYFTFIKNSYLKCFSRQILRSKYFINETYLGKTNEILLNLKLKNFPAYVDSNYDLEANNFDRDNLNLDYKCDDEFQQIIKKIIFKFIPSTYIENFENLNTILSSKILPQEPKVIFSSHLLANEILALYSAKKIEKNKTKLIYGQHGGVYGQYKFQTLADHEIILSDKYLTWGWDKNKKTEPFGIIKETFKINKGQNKNILIILRRNMIFYERLHSGAWLSHKENLNFILSLLKKIRTQQYAKSIIIRLHARRYKDYNEYEIFKDHNINMQIDNGSNSIKKLIAKSKLVINTYIATAYLELCASNIPNILFLKSHEGILDETSSLIFTELKKNNMYFNNPDELKKFLSKNINDIDKWWYSKDVQKSRKLLCKKFANTRMNKVKDLSEILKKQN